MIENIKILPDSLHVKFTNNIDDNFPNIWLRDHAKDDENWDQRSHQSKTITAKLDTNLFIKEASVRENGNCVNILWSDSEKMIKYSTEFLQKNLIKKDTTHQKFSLWKSKDINDQVYLNYNDVVSDDGFKFFLKNLYEYGFCVVTNCKTNMETVDVIANKIGYVRQSIFGGLWEFESNAEMADSAYTQEELRPHTDSTYSKDAPGLQLLLCCDYDATGGESIMVDGFKIAETLKKQKEIFEILSNVEVPGKYVGDGVILEARRPIFRHNSKNELTQVSFNNYDRAEFRMENELMLKFYEAIKQFDNLANNIEYQWRHILKPGELLIFNNWRVLHGRGSFQGKRKMAGCYINMEDFESICKINNIF